MKEFAFILCAYLLGSVPFGLWLGLWLTGKDVRRFGSGNIGASNVWRTLGWKIGLPVTALDVGKGLGPVLAARHFVASGVSADPNYSGTMIVLTGLAAIIGHNSSIFLKFKGGKGVATSLGVAVGMSWKAGLAAFLVWTLVLGITRYISVASLVSVPVGSVCIWIFNGETIPFVVFGILATVFSFIKHKSNIQRLMNGTELKVGVKSEKQVDVPNE